MKPPIVYQMEMSPVFDQKDPIDLRSPEAGTLAAREEDDQYAHGKKVQLVIYKLSYSIVITVLYSMVVTVY